MADNSTDEPDDDDNHYCIKCKSVIAGIDNYVNHRKQKCNETQVTTFLISIICQ